MNLKKLERYLRVNLLWPGPRLIKKKNLPGRGLTKVEKHCLNRNKLCQEGNTVTQQHVKNFTLGHSGDQPYYLVTYIRGCMLEVNSTVESRRKNSRSSGAYTQSNYAMCNMTQTRAAPSCVESSAHTALLRKPRENVVLSLTSHYHWVATDLL